MKNLKKSDYKVKQRNMGLVHYFRLLQLKNSFVCIYACVCMDIRVCAWGGAWVDAYAYTYIKK